MKSWEHYHPHLPELIHDPFPAYSWLRENEPVKYIPSQDIWAVSRYDDILACVRNTQAFSNSEGVGYARREGHLSLTSIDHPLHTRLRRQMRPYFNPDQILEKHTVRAQALMDELLDEIIDVEGADFAKKISMPFLSRLVGEWMGVPVEDVAFINDGATASSLVMAGDSAPEVMRSLGAFSRYWTAKAVQIEAIREMGGICPMRNLTDALYSPGPDGKTMTSDESLAQMQLLGVGGNETTGMFLSNTMHFLAGRADLQDMIRNHPERMPAIVEEMLRFISPVQGLFRNTIAEATVAGVTIPSGSKVLMLYASGNHDPTHYDDPDTFVWDRFPNGQPDADHLSFAEGRHICLGQHLARLMTTTMLRTICTRVEEIRLTSPIERSRNALVRCVDGLPVHLVSKDKARLAAE